MQFIDLKAQYAALRGEINANIQAVLDSAQFIGGRFQNCPYYRPGDEYTIVRKQI